MGLQSVDASNHEVMAAPHNGDRQEENQRTRVAHRLANNHKDVSFSRSSTLLEGLPELKVLLQDVYKRFRGTTSQDLTFSYAGEWMLDNYYIVEETLRQIQEDLPQRYYRQLPRLNGSSGKAVARIYVLAQELVASSASHLDLDHVKAFTQEYQQVTALTMGELWALPTMLRINILESLAHAAVRITGMKAPGKHSTSGAVLPAPEKHADEAIVGNCFLSLRQLAAQDWKTFFEEVNLVEQVLQTDPAGVYALVDFETRNQYRRVVEDLARATGSAEQEVARQAIGLAQAAANSQPPGHNGRYGIHQSVLDCEPATHVGFYLLDAGRKQLEERLHYRPTITSRAWRWLLAHPTLGYLGSIAVLAGTALGGFVSLAASQNFPAFELIGIGLLSVVAILTVAIGLVNCVVTYILPPRTLPRLDFESGIPASCQSIVVIPTMLTTRKDIETSVRDLELQYVRNSDPHLSFALLTDFLDADSEHMPGDQALLDSATAGIEGLNQKYRGQNRGPFYLFHRSRVLNEAEGRWMGWERKRGKLVELNRLLRGTGPTSFVLKLGDLNLLSNVKYVITLDADTILPRGSGSRLIATLAHPLNRARFEAEKVVSGYTVLQPRVEIKPTSADQSRFTRIFAGDVGLDLYTRAVSDVYQDLFGEGIYVGKGIYDVDAFQRCLDGRVPDNTLLSHDLFEGLYGRAALLTDTVLLEDYPPHYLVHSLRLHRWIRGDWQLLPWLLPWVPTVHGKVRNPFSIIDRWKILDNLRRSLLSPVLIALLTISWLQPPQAALFLTIVLCMVPAVSLLTQMAASLAQSVGQRSPRDMLESIRLPALRWLLLLVFLPYEATVSLDAIFTTLVRMTVTRRHLLEWTTAAHTSRRLGASLEQAVIWERMLIALVCTTLITLTVSFSHPDSLPVAVPLILGWLISPQIAYWISSPLKDSRQSAPLPDEQRQQLRSLARRTWMFFEQFVDPDEHWLPPDHFQEAPRGIVAHHTSPTNIGLLLLSTVSAHDFGYLGLLDLSLRLRSVLESMGKLERYQGHFLNWYDTHSLEPLLPRYVSTVDSGNLFACLLTLRQACLELPNSPIVSPQQWQGLVDLLTLLDETVQTFAGKKANPVIDSFQSELRSILTQIEQGKDQPVKWPGLLHSLSSDAWDRISRILMQLLDADSAGLKNTDSLVDLRLCLDRTRRHLENLQRDVDMLLPWLALFAEPPVLFSQSRQNLALQESWQALVNRLTGTIPGLGDAVSVYGDAQTQLKHLQELLADGTAPPQPLEAARQWCVRLDEALVAARLRVQPLLTGFQTIAEQSQHIFQEMDFRFLYEEQRQIFHIGYNVTAGRMDSNYYDLLASEARIASLVCIAKGDVPQSHWLHLGRPITQLNGERVLLSWSGTMFEYLMPSLFVRTYEHTLLSACCRATTDYQIAYGRQKHVPWGVSEAGYYAFDANRNYQYKAFGAPKLGFKRGLEDELVIAPYASMIALSVNPQAVVDNMARLDTLAMRGVYGFYEAVDFTSSRLPAGENYARVQSYMAHHQGMILLSLCNYLHGDAMVQRLHRDERIQSIELLLQEKIPTTAPIEYPHQGEAVEVRSVRTPINADPWRVPLESSLPQTHFLSSKNYGLLITNSGAGYSQWRDIALTRWRADTTLDDCGTWIYVQDQDTGTLWSAAYQPIASTAGNHEVFFYPDKVEFRCREHGIALLTEVVVATDEAEIRRITLTNESPKRRRLKLTSYGEVVLAPHLADQRHPAFNKLFIENEYLAEINTLLFWRRPRSPKETMLYLAHMLLPGPGVQVSGEFECSRLQFLGRGQSLRHPMALQRAKRKLPGTGGATLDPVMSLAQEVDLEPHATAKVVFVTMAGLSRDDIVARARRYQSWTEINSAFEDAFAESELELHHLGLTSPALERIQQLLSVLMYPHRALRASPDTLMVNRLGQSGLWAYGISGDYPILLARINDSDTPLLRDLLQAFTYWHKRQIKINLVLLNLQDTGYSLELQNHLYRQIMRVGADSWLNQRDGLFLLRADQMREADRILLETAASAILDSDKGALEGQLVPLLAQPVHLPAFVPTLPKADSSESTPELPRPKGLLFDNGLGGFSPDGREYMIYLEQGRSTPYPWINVIANPESGFIVSESGAGYSWSINSGENRLTPWANDPVLDTPGEVLYLRDEETGQIWTPTPLPISDSAPYLVHHGPSYSLFEHHSEGLLQHLRLFVSPDAPVKIVKLRLENAWERQRRITVTCFAEWVLGTVREASQPYVITEFEATCNALLAYNRYNTEFGERVAFVAANKSLHGVTADRTEFLGLRGSRSDPAALHRIGLASASGAGLDPCAALQLHIDLGPGGQEEVYFLIGQASNREAALNLIRYYQNPVQVDTAWGAVGKLWDDVLETVSVNTPDQAMNIMLNRWLLYQTLSCRVWGRSALYQSSGAFGFRDQLQDILGLLHSKPSIAREHILDAARRQFEAGDVLHWWHPPSGRGIRTRFSDDLLWLPFVTAHYVAVTEDLSILDEKLPFLKGDALRPDEDERYDHFLETTEVYTLHEHCLRAIAKGSTAGSHGLPLIGTGDWNDGMNRVGNEGRGESVWLGWFLYATLMAYAPFCESLGDGRHAAAFRQQATDLRDKLEQNAWDGNWYRRAYYDDGSALGSSRNSECQIDSIAQSWAVLSHAADPTRAAQALEAVVDRLLRQDEGLLLLLTPPFNTTIRDPGYIRGYPPGIRENGGQYTHAALWVAWAFAELGQGNRAESLFRLLNPINHGDSPSAIDRYKVEPYVIAADVYSESPHTGQGGWTWYTGSAAWMYRLGVEAILGLRRSGKLLRIDPCIPANWPAFSLTYRYGTALYRIDVQNPDGVCSGIKQVILDGATLVEPKITLHEDDDPSEHHVIVLMGVERSG